MKKILWLIASCALLGTTTASADVSLHVDPGANWIGFMNVYNTPANGGAYVFGSSWGFNDLTAVFNPTGSTAANLTLGPNSVNDPSAFWYTPSGGPGSTGNKITDANMYVENNTYANTAQTVTFSGLVTSNTFTSNYTTVAFIREFDQNYNVVASKTTPDPFIDDNSTLLPGAFSLSLNLVQAPTGVTYHVQYGFDTKGPDVWVTDRAPIGTLTVQSLPGDVNRDGHIDTADLVAMESALTIGPAAYAAQLGYFNAGPPSLDALNAAIAQVNRSGDVNFDGSLTNADLQAMINLLKAGGGSTTAVPEPASFVMLALSGLTFAAKRRRKLNN